MLGTTLRALAFAALAFVLLLQNIVATGQAHARRAGVGAPAATSLSKLCMPGAAGDAQHADHKAACVLCCGAQQSPSPPPREAASNHLARRIAVFLDRAPESPRTPSAQSGWASSWSSRAPPARP
ncbi:hypothetical protein A1351_13595 [Methylosinus sp. R-45379]|uniref:hypothetical protein n=1 Tax=unclassified Methylosinus TaxID=2624500 RepID=UPI000467AC19|nr:MULTISPECIES: hypothetical protein [unclassified Methylosinus]OAI27275.1 hypothetical protein A1351_13595 [Methylosinus sp. R-45379]TDX64269.1 hypothetical protein EDE12_105105 [Methylosinus sp. sav-2]